MTTSKPTPDFAKAQEELADDYFGFDQECVLLEAELLYFRQAQERYEKAFREFESAYQNHLVGDADAHSVATPLNAACQAQKEVQDALAVFGR